MKHYRSDWQPDAPELGLDHFLASLPATPTRRPDLCDDAVLDFLVRGLVGDLLVRAGQRAEGKLSNRQNSEADIAACHQLIAIFSGQDTRFQLQKGWHGGALPNHVRSLLESHPQVQESALATDNSTLQAFFALLVLEVYDFIGTYDEADGERQNQEVIEDIIGKYVHYLRGIPHDQVIR